MLVSNGGIVAGFVNKTVLLAGADLTTVSGCEIRLRAAGANLVRSPISSLDAALIGVAFDANAAIDCSAASQLLRCAVVQCAAAVSGLQASGGRVVLISETPSERIAFAFAQTVRSLASELGRLGIAVNGVRAECLTADETAVEPSLFLASPWASFVTGVVLRCGAPI
jgi:hypothetical protein